MALVFNLLGRWGPQVTGSLLILLVLDSLPWFIRKRHTTPRPRSATDDHVRHDEERQLLRILNRRSVMWEADVSETMSWSDATTTEILDALEEIGSVERHWTPRGAIVALAQHEPLQ